MKIKTSLAMMAIASIIGCSSGGSDSSGGSSGNQQGQVQTPDLSGTRPVEDYPSNEELTAANGVPSVEQARALIEGSWSSVDSATQCVTTYQAGKFGAFSYVSSNQRASGSFSLDQTSTRLVMTESYTSENFLTNCFGFTAESDDIDPGVSFEFNIDFPDQNTMRFLSGGNSAFYTFTR